MPNAVDKQLISALAAIGQAYQSVLGCVRGDDDQLWGALERLQAATGIVQTQLRYDASTKDHVIRGVKLPQGVQSESGYDVYRTNQDV